MTTEFDTDTSDNTSDDASGREPGTDSLEDLRTLNARRAAEVSAEQYDVNALEVLDLPGADLSSLGELEVEVVPVQPEEFTCGSCFLVQHRSRRSSSGSDTCRDCA